MATSAGETLAARRSPASAISPLEPGDRLTREEFERLQAHEQGVFRSERFPGLWLNAQALLKDDLAGTLRTLDEGLATAEHAAFAARPGGAV